MIKSNEKLKNALIDIERRELEKLPKEDEIPWVFSEIFETEMTQLINTKKKNY